jgi:hypothetical protein
MIQITIDESEPIGQFILAKAQAAGKQPDEIAREMTLSGFETVVGSLHGQFMRGEFSQGYFAEQLGISRLDLMHLLDAMGLPATNV